MSNIIPFGAAGAWQVSDDVAQIAEHYGLPAKALKDDAAAVAFRDPDAALQARDALFWKLVRERGLTAERVAAATASDDATVRAGVATHQARIQAHRARVR